MFPKKLYIKSRDYLATHKKTAFVLSHGLLHIIIFIIISVLLIVCITNYKKNQPHYSVFESSISLVDKPYIPCNSLRVSVKPIPDKEDSRFTFVARYDTIKDVETRSSLPENSEQWPQSRVIWKWKNSNKTTLKHIDKLDDGRTINITDSGFICQFPNYNSFSVQSQLTTAGNMPSPVKGNPYIDCFFKINVGKYELNDSLVAPSLIEIDFGTKNDEITIFDNVYPTPTHYGISKIKFEGADAVKEVLDNGGIYITAKNNVRAKKFDQLFLIISILGGTLIAFLLDIIITLIYKWRRLTK